MSGLVLDPWFYAATIPAVILTGLSKGGFGGAVGLIGVPMMALAMPPVQAAAILLPILCLMDIVSVWTWWGVYDRRMLVDMMPGAVAGIGLGWLTAAFVTEEMVRLIVGTVAIVFVLRWIYVQIRHGATHSAQPNRVAAAFWGTIAGFTSFVAHVGGPPFQIYALPIRLDPKVLSGTSAILFAATNALKLVPYFALGQFDTANRTASAVLMPLAPLSTIAGAWLVRRMRPELFYPFTYATVAVVAVKLLWDGIAGLLRRRLSSRLSATGMNRSAIVRACHAVSCYCDTTGRSRGGINWKHSR
ncbi:putative integral membrane protein [Mesorhizobium metallidurans STM 2683]|uniref:Probable membrane transporter protein n=1 Tax=Mesorhizobium metallidurans STM 2683 TaxID=1297569 RepID=M5EJB4_9HYPH|nr:putative integral membrane protein [Mesorhizobium metallidurans STM 2683]